MTIFGYSLEIEYHKKNFFFFVLLPLLDISAIAHGIWKKKEMSFHMAHVMKMTDL